MLLLQLGIRANTKEGFSCFPSFEQLERDTRTSERYLHVAAAGLEAAGLIRRKVRRGRSTVFYICVGRLVKLAQANREAARIRRRAEMEAAIDPSLLEDEADVYADVAPLDDEVDPDQDNTDGLELDRQEVEPEEEEVPCRTVEQLAIQAEHVWPDHPTFSEDGGRSFLQKDLAECARLAGSPERAGEVLAAVYYENARAWSSVANSSKLGPYLKTCFPVWLTQYETKLNPEDFSNEVSQ